MEEVFDEDEGLGDEEDSPHAVQTGRFDPDVISALMVDPDPSPGYSPGIPLEVGPIEYAHPIQENTMNGKAIIATRAAVDELVAFLEELADAPAAEAKSLADFTGERLSDVSRAVNHALSHLAAMARSLGDVDAVHSRFGTLSAGILQTADTKADAATLDELEEKVGAINSTLIALEGKFSDEIYEAVKLAMEQIKACFERVTLIEEELDDTGVPHTVMGGHPFAAPAHTIVEGTMLTSASGAALTSLGDLLSRIEALELRAQAAEQRVATLESELAGKDGHILDHVSLPSKADVRALVTKEDPKGASLAAFVNPVTIFAHDKEYSPSSGWESAMKLVRKGGSFTPSELKLIYSTTIRYPVHYVGSSSKVEPGSTIECFKTLATWNDTTSGRRKKIEDSLDTAASSLSTYISHTLPAGGQLARVAEAMKARTEKWYATIHTFFDTDLQSLKDQGIPPSKTLILVSEYVIIIFASYFRRMQHLVEFADGTPRVDWLVELIWVNIGVLEEMEKITKGGDPKFNPTLASAFIRFLTKSTAETSATKLASVVAKIQDDLAKWDVVEMKREISRLQKQTKK